MTRYIIIHAPSSSNEQQQKDQNSYFRGISYLILFLLGHYIIYYCLNYLLWRIGWTNRIIFLGWWYPLIYLFTSRILSYHSSPKDIMDDKPPSHDELLSYYILHPIFTNLIAITLFFGYWSLGIYTGLGISSIVYLILRRVIQT